MDSNHCGKGLCLAVWLLLLGPASSMADAVYKSVDGAGNVTYSSTPPGGSVHSENLAVPPPPTPEQQQEATRIERRMQGLSRNAVRGVERDSSQSRQRVTQAEAQLQAARTALEQASIKTDDDWQNLAQGGRHLKESYFQRVSDAEAAVQKAEEELAKARRDMR